VAYRMLGSLSEAEDAVQEAWLRLNGIDTATIENLAGWLTTVVSRVCLDMLRGRKLRRELLAVLDPDAVIRIDGAARSLSEQRTPPLRHVSSGAPRRGRRK
jgi:DNA-directed RNA polymerase specialized sigma24 family protein